MDIQKIIRDLHQNVANIEEITPDKGSKIPAPDKVSKVSASFQATISLLKQLFIALQDYPNLPRKLYNDMADISDFLDKINKGKLSFRTMSNQDLLRIKQQVLNFVVDLHELLPSKTVVAKELTEAELMGALKPFRLLVVCNGNIGRSPALEASVKFVAKNMGFDKLEVKSCGTFNLMQKPAQERVKQPLLTRMIGTVLGGMPAQSITEELCAWADMILTASGFISTQIVGAFPGAKNKVITAKEFVSGHEFDIAEVANAYAFYVDDPVFTVMQEQALAAWKKEGKPIPEFFKKLKADPEFAKQFLYRGKYPKGPQAESISVGELLRLAFAVVELLICGNLLFTDEVKANHDMSAKARSQLLARLRVLRKSTL